MNSNRYIVEIVPLNGFSEFTESFSSLEGANGYVNNVRLEYPPTTRYRVFKLVPVIEQV